MSFPEQSHEVGSFHGDVQGWFGLHRKQRILIVRGCQFDAKEDVELRIAAIQNCDSHEVLPGEEAIKRNDVGIAVGRKAGIGHREHCEG